MQAFVYKSRRKPDTYVYLREREVFGPIPEPLRDTLGPFDFVLEVALTPGRRLAREEASVVRANLEARGFHLQLPPVGAAVLPAVEHPSDLAALAAATAAASDVPDGRA